MTRAGEKLYGDWKREMDRKREGVFSSRRFWIGFAAIWVGVWLAG